MPIYFKRPFLLNQDSWTAGSGSIGNFNQNGATPENVRALGTDPFGGTSLLWTSVSAGGNTANGGWTTNGIPIDNTKLYRATVWVKRTSSSSSGTFYFGTGSDVTLITLDESASQSNPYWQYTSMVNLTQNLWYLFVGHIFPYDYPIVIGALTDGSVGHPNSGFWYSGVRQGIYSNNLSGFRDIKFAPTSTTMTERNHQYSSTNTTDTLVFFDPRIQVCDGSEGSIESLLSNDLNNKLISTSVTKDGASSKHQKVVATGGSISEVGQWRIHTFTSTGSFVVSSFLGSGLPVDFLIVAGGGGGGMDMGGGGGGGGVLNGSMVLTTGITYTVTVGGGGAGAPAAGTLGQPSSHQYFISGVNGSNSSFNRLTAFGGGFGGSSAYTYTPDHGTAGAGGCGGASSGYSNGVLRAGATGVAGQGFDGGLAGPQYYSGGGGGAGAVGASSTGQPNGGIGKLVNIYGRPYYWGGGGGGASYSLSVGGNGGVGGGGGGAVGATTGGKQSINWGVYGGGGAPISQTNTPGGDGGTYSGGGGGGGSHYNATNRGGNGGGGIVIIRYKYK